MMTRSFLQDFHCDAEQTRKDFDSFRRRLRRHRLIFVQLQRPMPLENRCPVALVNFACLALKKQ